MRPFTSPVPGEPSEFDQEAQDHWTRLFREADLDPKIHVLNGGEADNFWMMGDTGPCGPCSEVHIDLTPDGDTRGALVNKGDPRCIEIWNLVFIQFNANPDGTFMPLPQRHVDTGMGFERVTAIIQDTKNLTDFSGTISNYDTDIFRPIFDELEKLSGKKIRKHIGQTWQRWRERAGKHRYRISCHRRSHPRAEFRDCGWNHSFQRRSWLRLAQNSTSRGALRSLVGVSRALLLQACRCRRENAWAMFFQRCARNKSTIKETIKREEESFNSTLDRGIELFEGVVLFNSISAAATEQGYQVKKEYFGRSSDPDLEEFTIWLSQGPQPVVDLDASQVRAGEWREFISRTPAVSAEDTFKLYDTYGFPLDLTELVARERGLTVDVAGFEKLMDEQRERARKAQKKETIASLKVNLSATPTKFLGYDFLETESVVEAVLPGQKSEEVAVVLDQTPLYAEMGGQVGDRGLLHVPGHDRTEVGQLRVIDTQKRGDVFVHCAQVIEGRAPEPGEAVRISVDADRRKLIQGHHTVTHLLHWALHEVVARDTSQKGSYVGPDKLTFDFSSAPLTKDQVRNVEKLVNEKISESAPVSWTEIPYAEAKQRGDIVQFFGEKYGDRVRVLQIGGTPRTLNGYSMELCGGTHVRSTGEIGPFRIVKEEAIAAGVRRIEAVAGDAARAWAKQEAARQQEKFETLVRKKPEIPAIHAFQNDADTSDVLQQIDARAADLEKLETEVRDWERQSAKTAEAELRSRAAQVANELIRSHAGEKFCVAEVKNGDGKLLQAVADTLKSKFDGPIFLVGATNGSVALVASVPKEMSVRLQANKLIQQVASIVGGKGGGRPENAQGAGKDASKIAEALAKARELLS